MRSSTPLHERIAAATLTTSEARVAAFISANPGLVAMVSTAELGERTSTSDATVVRTTKKLGYSSFRALRQSALIMSGRHRDPSKVLGDQVGQVSESATGARLVFRDTADALGQLDEEFDPDGWERAVTLLVDAERVITFGMGASGPVANFLALSFNRAGVRSVSVTSSGIGLADALLGIGPTDTVVLFATKRRFREVDVLLDCAKEVGAATILVSETLGEALRDHVDVALSTPPTGASTSSGVVMAMVVAAALDLAVAARDSASAVRSMERLNDARAAIVGRALDTDV